MDTYQAVSIIEGFSGEDHTEEEILQAWQALIDSGLVWRLQGFYGRTAQYLLDNGICEQAGAQHA